MWHSLHLKPNLQVSVYMLGFLQYREITFTQKLTWEMNNQLDHSIFYAKKCFLPSSIRSCILIHLNKMNVRLKYKNNLEKNTERLFGFVFKYKNICANHTL